MNSRLQLTIQGLLLRKKEIDSDRHKKLTELAEIITPELKNRQTVLNFICTHNSRRSQMSQAWALAAAAWFGIKNINSVSGGTEITSFNSRAVAALSDQGFDIRLKVNTTNPVYSLSIGAEAEIDMYSKTYQQATLEPFIAVMTCTNADDNCPIVAGATHRFSLPFTDPGHSDGAPDESIVYLETANQIGKELLFLFGKIKEKMN